MGFDLASIMKGGVEGVLGSVANIIGKFKADPNIAAQSAATIAAAEAELQKAQLDYERQLAVGQIEINKIEAASSNWFTSNWRPALGWVCVAAFAYMAIGWPVMNWVSINYGWKPAPELDSATLTTVLFGMLGLGTWRSFDKYKGTTRDLNAPPPPNVPR